MKTKQEKERVKNTRFPSKHSLATEASGLLLKCFAPYTFIYIKKQKD